MAFAVPAHKQRDPAKRPGQIVNPIQAQATVKGVHEARVWGHFPMGPTATGRESCSGSLESNDPKPATLTIRRQPVFASSIGDDDVSDL